MGLKEEILAISRRPENGTCVDCRMPQPTWASFNLGVFMCMTCAGHHRSLGTHITRVRSVTMDNWDAPSVSLMGSVGNIRGNSYWEARLPPHLRLHPGVDDRTRAEFIRSKYVQRSWYGVPAGGEETAAAPQAEQKTLSKMEQRQLRLQAKQQQQQGGPSSTAAPVTATTTTTNSAPSSATAPPTSTPQPSHPIRQSSVPLSTSSSSPHDGLFAGMNVNTKSSPAAVAASAVTAPAAASASTTPAKAVSRLPPKVTSASPWVSREELPTNPPQAHHAAVPTQSHHSMPVTVTVTAPAPVAQSAPLNLLDFGSPSEPVAATTAVTDSGLHAVDDMFAGLSVVAPPSSAEPTRATSGNSELLNFYANNIEPASAPARSQHTHAMPTPSHPPPPQPSASPSDVFSFMSEPAGNVELSATLLEPSTNASSFSFLSDDSSSTAAPSIDSSASAFSFLGGGVGDVPSALPPNMPLLDPSLPEMNTLMVLPGQYGTVPPMPMMPMGGMPGANGFDVNGAMAPMSMPMTGGLSDASGFLQPLAAPLTHSYSQPLAGGSFGYGTAPPPPHSITPSPYPIMQHQHQHPQQPSQSLQPTLAPLPPFSSQSTGMPQFQVQSVSTTQRLNQQREQEIANDPFAHIAVTHQQQASPAAVAQFQSSPSPTAVNAAPKQAHQCDVDGCTGTKVSRGLCAKHIRCDGANSGVAAPVASQPKSIAPAASTFDFLAETNTAQLQSSSPPTFHHAFAPLASTTTNPSTNEVSSFAFL